MNAPLHTIAAPDRDDSLATRLRLAIESRDWDRVEDLLSLVDDLDRGEPTLLRTIARLRACMSATAADLRATQAHADTIAPRVGALIGAAAVKLEVGGKS